MFFELFLVLAGFVLGFLVCAIFSVGGRNG